MKRKFAGALLITTLGCVGLLQAQTATDSPKVKDSVSVKYQISSDWTFTWGNVNSFISVNQGQLNVENRVIGSKVLVRYRYGELEAVQNYNEFYSNADLLIFPKGRVYGIANGGFEFSFLRGVNSRAWGGLGAGFKVLRSDDHKFEPTVTFNYEYNNYTTPILYRGDSVDVVHTAISNIGWTGSHKFFKGKLVLVHNYKWSQDLLFAENFRFDGGFTLSVPIIKGLSVKTSIVGSYQNVVSPPKKQADLIWTIGLAFGNI